MQPSKNKGLKILIASVALMVGPVLCLIYRLLLAPSFDLNLSENTALIGSVIVGVAFSTLGFLIASLALLLQQSATNHIQAFARLGRMDVIFMLFTIAMLNLLITGGMAVMLFSPKVGELWLLPVAASFINNVVQLLMISLSICNLVKKAAFGSG